MLKTMFHEVPHQRKQPINREGQVDKNYLSATAEKPKKVEPLPKISDETRGMTKGVLEVSLMSQFYGKYLMRSRQTIQGLI